jgi:hypothetical protein
VHLSVNVINCKNTAGMTDVKNEINLMEREYKNQIILLGIFGLICTQQLAN